MPAPTQYSVYDKGIPIAVDPRLPASSKATTAPATIPTKPISSGIPGFRHCDTRTLATLMQQPIIASFQDRNKTKRRTMGEVQESLPKRTKVDQPKSAMLQSPVHITPTQPSTSATTVTPSTPAITVFEPILTTPIENDGRDDANIAQYLTPADTADAKTDTTYPPIAKATPSTVPPIPLDAVDIIQKTSTNLLMALVQKDALDREHKLLVGVGTIRTCLDIHFMPHMESWKEDAVAIKPVASIAPEYAQAPPPFPPIQASPAPPQAEDPSSAPPIQNPPPVTAPEPVSVPATTRAPTIALRQPLSIAIPRTTVHTPASSVRSESGACLGITPNRKTLEIQLASARSTMEKQARDLRPKDDELVRSKEEIKRLEARLKKVPVAPAGHSQAAVVATLNRVVLDQSEKINYQKIEIKNLLGNNERLKEDLKAAQATSTEVEAKSQGVDQAKAKHEQNREKMDESDRATWQEVGAGGQLRHGNGPRFDRKQHRSHSSSTNGGSKADSVIIGPMPPLKQHSPISRSTQSSNITPNDPRSPWERNFAGQSKSSASSSTASGKGKGMPSAPIGPRLGTQGYRMIGGRGEIPMYVSENGWADYISKDGLGEIQADNIESE